MLEQMNSSNLIRTKCNRCINLLLPWNRIKIDLVIEVDKCIKYDNRSMLINMQLICPTQ